MIIAANARIYTLNFMSFSFRFLLLSIKMLESNRKAQPVRHISEHKVTETSAICASYRYLSKTVT